MMTGVDLTVVTGIGAPANTPTVIVDRLNREIYGELASYSANIDGKIGSSPTASCAS